LDVVNWTADPLTVAGNYPLSLMDFAAVISSNRIISVFGGREIETGIVHSTLYTLELSQDLELKPPAVEADSSRRRPGSGILEVFPWIADSLDREPRRQARETFAGKGAGELSRPVIAAPKSAVFSSARATRTTHGPVSQRMMQPPVSTAAAIPKAISNTTLGATAEIIPPADLGVVPPAQLAPSILSMSNADSQKPPAGYQKPPMASGGTSGAYQKPPVASAKLDFPRTPDSGNKP
jgi:hypothetical protein